MISIATLPAEYALGELWKLGYDARPLLDAAYRFGRAEQQLTDVREDGYVRVEYNPGNPLFPDVWPETYTITSTEGEI